MLYKAYFGVETWWPGRTCPGHTRRGSALISNQVDGHLTSLGKAVLAGARAVLPVYYTTPIAALHRESGLLPPEIELNQLALLTTVRLRRLDPYYLLYKRALRIIRTSRPTSRFARRVLVLPDSEHINPLQNPPWQLQESHTTTMEQIHGPCGRPKEQAASDFLSFYQALPQHDISLFSDRS